MYEGSNPGFYAAMEGAHTDLIIDFITVLEII